MRQVRQGSFGRSSDYYLQPVGLRSAFLLDMHEETFARRSQIEKPGCRSGPLKFGAQGRLCFRSA